MSDENARSKETSESEHPAILDIGKYAKGAVPTGVSGVIEGPHGVKGAKVLIKGPGTGKAEEGRISYSDNSINRKDTYRSAELNINGDRTTVNTHRGPDDIFTISISHTPRGEDRPSTELHFNTGVSQADSKWNRA